MANDKTRSRARKDREYQLRVRRRADRARDDFGPATSNKRDSPFPPNTAKNSTKGSPRNAQLSQLEARAHAGTTTPAPISNRDTSESTASANSSRKRQKPGGTPATIGDSSSSSDENKKHDNKEPPRKRVKKEHAHIRNQSPAIQSAPPPPSASTFTFEIIATPLLDREKQFFDAEWAMIRLFCSVMARYGSAPHRNPASEANSASSKGEAQRDVSTPIPVNSTTTATTGHSNKAKKAKKAKKVVLPAQPYSLLKPGASILGNNTELLMKIRAKEEANHQECNIFAQRCGTTIVTDEEFFLFLQGVQGLGNYQQYHSH